MCHDIILWQLKQWTIKVMHFYNACIIINPEIFKYQYNQVLCYNKDYFSWKMYFIFRHSWRKTKVKVLVTHFSLTLCNPMDCSPPGSSVHGIFLPRILECIAIFFSRESSQPRNWTRVSCIAERFFTVWSTSEAGGKQVVYNSVI